MSSEASERSLRRLVANLTQVSPGDREAVLAELEVDERRRVERLLGEFLGAATGAQPAAAKPVRLPGLSPWLAARLEGQDATPPSERRLQFWIRNKARDRVAPFSMTAHALHALRACAHDLAGGDAAAAQGVSAAPQEPRPRAPIPWINLLGGGGR